MKNITALAVLVIILNSAYCQDTSERNYQLSIGTQSGFVYGQALEYVYPTDTKGEFLSELKWDMKPVFYLGAQVGFGRIDLMKRPGFFASLSFNGGIPGDSGVMEDRDWQSVENGELTDFSRHTNKTCQFFSLDAAAGASFPIKNYLYVKPFFSGSWMHFSFSGRNGNGKYAKGDNHSIEDDPNECIFYGNVIRYSQDWLLIAAGISIGTKVLSPFSFDISLQLSPFAYCAGNDEHLKTDALDLKTNTIKQTANFTVYDYTGMGFYLEPRGGFSFTTKWMELSLEFAYCRIGKTRGDSYDKTSNGIYVLGPNKAGAGLSLFSSQFLFKVLL